MVADAHPAPEILEKRGYARPVDWWAFGVFLYEMLDGLPPFYSEDSDEMTRMILSYVPSQ